MAPHIERVLERGLPGGVHVARKLTRISRRGHPYWVIVSGAVDVTTVHAMLLFIDLMMPVTITGDIRSV